MKKIFLVALAAATMLTSCNGSCSAEGAKADTLSTTYGEMVGAFMYNNLKSNDQINKKEFMKGVAAALSTDTSRSDYMIGMQVGMQMLGEITQLRKGQKVVLDPEKVLAAMKAVIASDSLTVEPMALQQQFSTGVQEAARLAKENDPRAVENAKAGEAYINAEMQKDPEIKTTESGLAYKVIEAGDTAKFTKTDRIQVIYIGKKIDGTVFDSSNGQPVVFSPAGVVPGFGEALCMMGAGSKMIVYIPGKLAYGVDGAGDKIGPNETLIFEIETVGLEKKDEK